MAQDINMGCSVTMDFHTVKKILLVIAFMDHILQFRVPLFSDTDVTLERKPQLQFPISMSQSIVVCQSNT